MHSIMTYTVVLILSCCSGLLIAQDSISNTAYIQELEKLNAAISQVELEEKAALKREVERIDEAQNAGTLTPKEAQELKMEKAKKRALNIEHRLAILNAKIDLLKRNGQAYLREIANDGDAKTIRLEEDHTNPSARASHPKIDKDSKPIKRDLRTKSDFVIAFGLNNAHIEGEALEDTPYKIGGSRFLEIGWAWKYRVFKTSNILRFKYGASLHINGLKPKDNQYFVNNDNQISLDVFPEKLDKTKLTITNLVFPVHLEFGPSKKTEYKDYFRYNTRDQLKIGVGAYGGFNIGTRQKLKYRQDGERVKDKQKRGLNTSDLIYGLSGYIAIGEVALYAKYDLSPIFKDQDSAQNNISLGLRFDVD